MPIQLQVLALIIVILISVAVTNGGVNNKNVSLEATGNSGNLIQEQQPKIPSNLSFQAATLRTFSVQPPVNVGKKTPTRNWDVLDPKVTAAAVLVESLDDGSPFFYFQTYKPWPMASLTKLLTAVVVLEEIGANKKIEITKEVAATEGNGGGLKPGEIYTALDLLKIMTITSSNDAAAAFENYYGREALVGLLNEKARELQMVQTKIYDASGLSDSNVSSATDLAKLVRYVLERHPEVLNWSRLPSFLVQPINKVDSRNLLNINPLTEDKNFWGGKTGTSDAAKENLTAIFSFGSQRLLMVVLGSGDRFKDIETLLDWVGKAYRY